MKVSHEAKPPLHLRERYDQRRLLLRTLYARFPRIERTRVIN
jgi:hypothetical protein